MKEVKRVSSTTDDVMKNVSELALQARLEKLNNLDTSAIVYSSLSTVQINKLAAKINLLPSEYQNILFFRYCFESTDYEIENILETENTKKKLLYIQDLLSKIMKLENSWIDENSLKESCKLALEESMKDYNNIEELHQPIYSKDFRRKLKDIKIPQKSNKIFMAMAKRVAIFILVCFLSFSTVLVVNAEAREKFFDWIVETFPKFSIFIPQSTDNDTTDLKLLKINYVPTDFELINVNEGNNMIIYNYATEDNQRLDIKFFSSSSGVQSYYDTENTEIEEFIFKESNAYRWQTDEKTQLIWYQDGIECHITANLDIDEVIKIAENILK